MTTTTTTATTAKTRKTRWLPQDVIDWSLIILLLAAALTAALRVLVFDGSKPSSDRVTLSDAERHVAKQESPATTIATEPAALMTAEKVPSDAAEQLVTLDNVAERIGNRPLRQGWVYIGTLNGHEWKGFFGNLDLPLSKKDRDVFENARFREPLRKLTLTRPMPIVPSAFVWVRRDAPQEAPSGGLTVESAKGLLRPGRSALLVAVVSARCKGDVLCVWGEVSY